jgi:hypothetical protein
LTELEVVDPSGARKPLPRLSNGDLGIKPFMIQIMQERRNAIADNPSLIQTNPWPTTKPYYNLRKMLDHLGYNIDETYPLGHKLAEKVILAERRPYIQGAMLTDICEKYFGLKRHELGIFVDERSQFVYRGVSDSVGFYDIDELVKKGTDIILCEKAYAVKSLAPLAQPYSIALLECGGNFVEYARILCKKAVARGCNIGILTDFDISGVLMCLRIPWATRIGIDERTVYSLELTEQELREVEERYNPNPDQMTSVRDALALYQMAISSGKIFRSKKKGEDYNVELLRSLNLDQCQAFRYLKEKRIELDHVIDIVGPDRFFEYLKKTMENRFHDRDYYKYAIEEVTTDEIVPIEAKEFTARMRKFFAQIKGVQPAYSRLVDNLKNIEGLKPVDEERKKMVDELVEVTTEDDKSKRFMSTIKKVVNDFGKDL